MGKYLLGDKVGGGFIHNLYSNLFAFLLTKSWSTSVFPIQRGVFQGDSLSPLIFLLCFNPIVILAKKPKGEGFSLYLPIPNSDLLLDRTFMLNGKKSIRQIPMGYIRLHCCGIYHSDGTTTIQYLNAGASERVDLHSVLWSLAQKNSEIPTIRIHLKTVPSEKSEGGSLSEEIYLWQAAQGESLCG